MKLFSVSAVWRPTGCKKRISRSSVIMAESEQEAIEKFNKAVTYPQNAIVDTMEWTSGIFTMSDRTV